MHDDFLKCSTYNNFHVNIYNKVYLKLYMIMKINIENNAKCMSMNIEVK